MTEVISAVLGIVIGVFFTYVFDVRKSQAERRTSLADLARERRRNRETAATAILNDLKRLEFDLHQLLASTSPSRAATPHPDLFYDALRGEIRWFAASSIQPVANFFRQAEFVFSTLQIIRDAGQAQSLDKQREYHLQCLCAFALQSLPPAAKALRDEGGVEPESIAYPLVTYPDLPATPPKEFGDIPFNVPGTPGAP